MSDKEMYAERGFGNKVGFGERPALLVIDFITPHPMLKSKFLQILRLGLLPATAQQLLPKRIIIPA